MRAIWGWHTLHVQFEIWNYPPPPPPVTRMPFAPHSFLHFFTLEVKPSNFFSIHVHGWPHQKITMPMSMAHYLFFYCEFVSLKNGTFA